MTQVTWDIGSLYPKDIWASPGQAQKSNFVVLQLYSNLVLAFTVEEGVFDSSIIFSISFEISSVNLNVYKYQIYAQE